MAIIDNLGRIIESQESTLTELRSIVSTLMQEQVGPARPVGEKNETQSNAINDLKNVFNTYLEQWKNEVAAQRELLTKTVDVLNETQKQKKKKKISIRQVKYLNNIVEQDHRGIKRITRPTLGFKSFNAAQRTISGIELMRMLHKQQMNNPGKLSPAEQFYSLAG